MNTSQLPLGASSSFLESGHYPSPGRFLEASEPQHSAFKQAQERVFSNEGRRINSFKKGPPTKHSTTKFSEKLSKSPGSSGSY